MLTSFRVEQFRCLRDVTVPLHPVTVIIGKNDTGKTSFLDALQYFSLIIQQDIPGPFTDENPLRAISWKGATEPSIGWEIKFRTAEGLHAVYRLSVKEPPRPEPGEVIQAESLKVLDAEGNKATLDAILRTPDELKIHGKSQGKEYGVSTHQRVTPAPSYVPKNPDFIVSQVPIVSQSVKYDLDLRKIIRPSVIASGDGAPGIAPDGSGVAAFLDYLLGNDREAFDALEQELREAIPAVKSILLKPLNFRTRDAQGQDVLASGKVLAFRLQGGHEINASQASSGLLLFLTYLCILYTPSPPRILLLEEPENGIHPRQLERVARLLRRLTDPTRTPQRPSVQVVLTTHSPYLLDFVPPESVVVFGRKKSNGETVAVPLMDLPGVKERLEGGYSLGEMWFNVGEDELLAGLL